MPYKKTKLKGGKVRVTGPSGVHAKASTKKNADAQVRLLNAIDHGYKPDKKKRKGIPER
jgi:hypothetical protein